jgi:hypothetical protein
MRKTLALIIVSFCFIGTAFSQSDSTNLMNLFANSGPKTVYTQASFKTTRIVLGQSVEMPAKGDMILDIQHHFGYVNQGAYQFFGLDQATMRLGFEFGITNWLAVAVGRSSYNKTYDGSVKIKLLRQSIGEKTMPITMVYFGDMGINTLKPQDLSIHYYFSNRLVFLNQLLIARKFSPGLTLQLSPSLVHVNLVTTPADYNNIMALGAGGRIKITEHTSFNFEYYAMLNKQPSSVYRNSLSVGFDIETGGHVFQLFLSNSQGIIGQYFIPGTTGNWRNGDIVFGFNLTRTFVLKKPKVFDK